MVAIFKPLSLHSDFYSPKWALSIMMSKNKNGSNTVVREKYTIQNIHFKIINHKKFLSFLVIDENFYGWIFNACIKFVRQVIMEQFW